MSQSHRLLRVSAPLRLCVKLLFTVATALTCAAEPEASQPMEQIIARYRADRDSLNNFYESVHPSTFYEDRLSALNTEWLDKLGPYNFDSLDQQGRIDFLMLRDSLQHERAVIGRQRAKLSAIETMIPFQKSIQELETSRSHAEAFNGESAAMKVTAIPEQIKKLRERLEKGRKEKREGKKSRRKRTKNRRLMRNLSQKKRRSNSNRSKRSVRPKRLKNCATR